MMLKITIAILGGDRENPELEHLGRLYGREGSLKLGFKGKIRWEKRKCPSDRRNNMNKGMETEM